jgi:DNA-binding response OmpR family regulator
MSDHGQGPGFDYEFACDSAGLPASVAVFADRAAIRGEVMDDLSGAGFRPVDGGPIRSLLEGQIAVLGDIVLLDCPVADVQVLAALSRLDTRIARAGAELIVATSLEALDEVFAALDQSSPQILVNPTRAERVVAVGRVMGHLAKGRVREMADEDRIALVRLSQQVEKIARELERLSERIDQNPSKLEEPKPGFRGKDEGTRLPRSIASKLPLPDARLVRQIIANRQARARFFDGDLFADPAWDMLLDLTAAHAEHRRISVTSLCIAAGVPATTALRWIKQLVEAGVFERVDDASDRRRAFIALSESSREAMARYFAETREPLAAAA